MFQQFCNLIFDVGLDQLISLPTHIKSNTLDLLLTNIEDKIDSIKVHSDPLPFPSDYYSITFNLSLSKPPVKQATYYCYNYTKGDYQGPYEYLSHLDLDCCFLSHDVEVIWEMIESILSNAMRLFIPFNKIHCHQQPVCQYYTSYQVPEYSMSQV